MKVECIHGYFKFSEVAPGQLSNFSTLFDAEIERSGDHFTFSDLVDAPRHSIAGGLFLGTPTIKTFEGEPWDVMRENRLVYDFRLGLIIPLDAVLEVVSITQTGNYFITTGMLLAGSITDDGSRVTDYSAFYVNDRQNFKYSEIDYE